MTDIKIPEDVYDIIIVGGGPGGLTAGLYAARASYKVLLLEGSFTTSQITVTDMIENYPGIPGVSGFELIDLFKKQATGFGLDIRSEQVVLVDKVHLEGTEGWILETDNAAEYRALSIVFSTGAEWRRLGVAGEEELIGRGVSFCATCDAPFYKNKHVAVVGGGNAAVQEAIYLTKFVDRVTLIHRRNRLRATGILQKRAFANKKIEFAWDSVVERIVGNDRVEGVSMRNVKEPEKKTEILVDGVFVFVGLTPSTKLVEGIVELDEGGYIVADGEMKTSAKGIFACGDCIKKSLRQVVTACGDGATAANSAGIYVDALKGESY
jgi:thioredoxin reductase (NADPH)